jgi:hypothetical protein
MYGEGWLTSDELREVAALLQRWASEIAPGHPALSRERP